MEDSDLTGESRKYVSEGLPNLRQRKKSAAPSLTEADLDEERAEDPNRTFGRTPDGIIFVVPHTKDIISSLFDPRLQKSTPDLVILASLATQCLAFFCLPNSIARYFFVLYCGYIYADGSR